MKRYEIFACFFAALLLVGSVSAAEKGPRSPKRQVGFSTDFLQQHATHISVDPNAIGIYDSEEVYFELPVVTQEATLTSVIVGPCRWSVHGRQITYVDDTGYELGLSCTEPDDENFKLTFGVGKNQNETLYIGKPFQSETDQSAFITFRLKIGR